MRARFIAIAIGLILVGGCADPVPSVPVSRQSPTPMSLGPRSPTHSPVIAATTEPTSEPTLPTGFPGGAIWFSGRLAVTLDGQHRVELTEGERPLAVWDNVFVTAVRGPRGASRIRVRDIRTDEVLQDVAMADQIQVAVIVGDAVYMTGLTRLRSSWRSLGIVRLSIADGAITRAARPGRETTADNLVRSPSGRIIAVSHLPVDTNFQGAGPTAIDIHRVGGSTRRDVVPATEMNLMALTDDVMITRDERRVRAYAVSDGREIWDLPVGGTGPGFVTPDGTRLIEPLFLEDAAGQRWVIAVVDAATGRVLRELQARDLDVSLVAHASNDRYALFGGDKEGTYRSLHLETGALEEHPLPE